MTMRSAASATRADGYHPTGMRPTSASLPLAVATPDVAEERSNTATALLSASATNSRVPSGERASAFGVLPSPVPAGEGSLSVVRTCLLRVSTTLMRSVLPDTAKSLDPSPLRRSAEGCRATLIFVSAANVPPDESGKADTVIPFHADTNTVPSGVTATPYG